MVSVTERIHVGRTAMEAALSASQVSVTERIHGARTSSEDKELIWNDHPLRPHLTLARLPGP